MITAAIYARKSTDQNIADEKNSVTPADSHDFDDLSFPPSHVLKFPRIG